VWTIGYGRTKGINENTKDITQEQAEAWLAEDSQESFRIARRVVNNYDQLSDVRKGVLVNMAFNLGEPRLRGFKNTLRFIESGQWSNAAMGMLNSKWARQVGQRATELAARMSSDTIPPHRLYRGE
jgi:lysozyme